MKNRLRVLNIGGKQMSKYPFYGVSGVQGYAVYTDYSLVLKNRGRLSKVNSKGFYTFEEAKAWCEERYYYFKNFMPDFIYFGIIGELKEVNKMYLDQYGKSMVGVRIVNHRPYKPKSIPYYLLGK